MVATPAQVEQPEHGRELLLAGDGEMWLVDADADSVRRIAAEELTPGDPPHRVLRAGDRFVLWGYATYVLEGERLREIVADSHVLFPSAHPDRVWLGIADSQGRLNGMREVSHRGEVTAADAKPAVQAWPVAATDGGLVYGSETGTLLWDPVAGSERTLDVAGVVTGAGGWLVACDDPCRDLVLFGVDGSDRRSVELPDGFEAWEAHAASFAPDTQRLAVPVRRGSAERGSRELAIVDVATGAVQVVAGSEVPAGYVMTAWARDHVYVTGGERFGERVIAGYRVGDESARRLRVTVGDFYDMAAR